MQENSNSICEFYVNGSGYFSFHRASSSEWTPATTEMPNVNTQVTWFIDYKKTKGKPFIPDLITVYENNFLTTSINLTLN